MPGALSPNPRYSLLSEEVLMKKVVFLAGVFLVVSAITTGGVTAAQYGGGQADKPKADSSQKSDEKSHTMTGCLEKGTDEDTFRLTSIEGTGPKTAELHADAKLKLSAHVGHKVAITGTAVDPKTMKKGTGTATGTTGTTPGAESKETAAEHHMKVTSMKHISPTCSQ
jgi:hypothetical protein